MWAVNKRAVTVSALVGLVALLPAVAFAQTTFEYNTQPRTFRVCYLVLGPGGPVAATPNALIFEGMRRYPGKPAGWELENPLVRLGNLPPMKHLASYWAAPQLDANYDPAQGYRVQSLRDMDLIYISAPTLDLTLSATSRIPAEWREAIIQAVHEGAVLWVDQPHSLGAATNVVSFAPPGGMMTTGAPFTFTFQPQTAGSYRRSYAGVWPADGGDLDRNLTDRLLQYPYRLDEWRDVQYLGMYPQAPNLGTSNADPTPPAQAQSASPDVVNLVDPSLRPVVVVRDGTNWFANVAVGRFGAGAVVVSAGDIGYDVCNWWQGANHLNRPVQHQEADCKFAWNVLAMAQSFSERGGSSSNSAASPVAAVPPLGIQWQFPTRFDSAAALQTGPVVAAPAIGRRMSYVLAMGRPASGGGPALPPCLMAFDNDPAYDLDQDGRADDGLPDFALGRPYDMVARAYLPAAWSGADSDLTTRWSSPTVATIRVGGLNVEVVLVSQTRINPAAGGTGFVTCFRASDLTPLWQHTVNPYNNSACIVDLSTPTVYGDYAFVLASEYDPNADIGVGAEDTYGRAYCFRLSDPAGVVVWSFPNASTNPNGDGDTTAAAPDNAAPELQRYLPPFQDPYWVARVAPYATRPELPPFPTAKPAITEPNPPASHSGLDVLLTCTSPISLRKVLGGMAADNDLTRGGSDWVLVPTPMTAVGTGSDLLNQRYYRVWLPAATALTDGGGNYLVQVDGTGIVQRVDDSQITATVTDADTAVAGIQPYLDPVDGRIYAYLRSGEAREYLLPSLNIAVHWMDLIRKGAPITIPYRVRANAGVGWAAVPVLSAVDTLAPPVRRVIESDNNTPNQRRTASATTRRGSSIISTDVIDANDGTLMRNDLTTPASIPPTAPIDPIGRIKSVDNETGETNWSVRADMMALDAYNLSLQSRGGVAVDPATGTAVAAVTSTVNPGATGTEVRPSVLGLNAEPKLVIQLRDGGPDAQLRTGALLQIRTLNWDRSAVTAPTDLPVTAYKVDATSKTIEFVTNQAAFDNGTVGALWGKPVWVTYTRIDPANPTNPANDVTVSDELHILPDIARFTYTPYLIRLNHSMVCADAGAANSISLSLPNGVPLTGAVAASPTISAASLPTSTNPANPPAGWVDLYGRALLNVTNLQMPGGEVLRPGSEFIVTYAYLDPVTLTVQTAHERHQVPVNFGTSASSPALAGYNMHVGTEGYRPDAMRGPNFLLMNPELYNPAATPTPAQYSGTSKSLLSVVLDPISQAVRGSLGLAAIPATTIPGTPVVSAPPALDGDAVLVGSRMMQRLSQVAAAPAGYHGEGYGYVSRLKPQRTLVCDTTRLVETTGSKLTWVCTGTMAPEYHEALDPTNLGNQELKVTPFSRPAKATYLPNGNMLVADTGNNRVVEIDRQGRQVWPLDINGYDYYTSTPALNTELALDRPADCFRYYVEYNLGTIRTSTNGSMLPLSMTNPADTATWRGTVMHTVIADTGNARVVDVVTVISALGVQAHRVDVLTPSRVRLAQGMVKLAYTKAIPIFEPDLTPTPNNSNPVLGYLCAAANMHQLVVIEAGTKRVNPLAGQTAAAGNGGTWRWLAWLYNADVSGSAPPTDPLLFRNIRDVELVREGGQAFLTVTCGQYGGRLSATGAGTTPHWLAGQGAGVFEFAMDVSGAPATWARISPADAAGGPTVTVDDPIWYFTNLDYTYGSYTYDYATRQLTAGTRRSLTNVQYHDPADATGTNRWLEMPWNPVSCIRLPADRRPLTVGGAAGRSARHLITNFSELVQNLSRENVAALTAPAMLFSSVFAVDSDDRADAAPENDTHEMDRREVIPDPHEPDWTDPINQPAYADRR